MALWARLKGLTGLIVPLFWFVLAAVFDCAAYPGAFLPLGAPLKGGCFSFVGLVGKGYRMEFNFSQAPCVGRGNTADVFLLDEGQVLKLFHSGYPESGARKEYDNARQLAGKGLPVVEYHEFVEIEGRYGVILQRLAGNSMLEALAAGEDAEEITALFARVHRQLLGCRLPEAPSYQEALGWGISQAEGLTEGQRGEMQVLLHTLPEGDCFCHGDYHFGNVLLTPEGPCVIDLMDACRGPAQFDMARSLFLIEFSPLPEGVEEEPLLCLRELAAALYLREMGVEREELLPWMRVTAAAKLHSGSGVQGAARQRVLDFLF